MVAGVHPTAQLEPIGTYAIVDLGTLGGTSSEASGVNLLGDVAGASMMVSGRQHAFLFRGGRLMDLWTLIGGISSYATAVADTGMVVGYSDIDLYGFGIPGGIEGFVWQNGAMKSLGALWCPCSSSRRYGTSRAFAVNNAGLIVGGSLAMTHGHGQFTQAFMFQTNRMDDVGSWEDGRASSSTAFGINDLGEIAA